MEDGRKNNGGNKNAGRKGKAEEQKLIEKLTPLNDIAMKSLEKAIKNDDSWAVKLYFEYYYGKAHQRIDVTTNDESLNIPIINFAKSDD